MTVGDVVAPPSPTLQLPVVEVQEENGNVIENIEKVPLEDEPEEEELFRRFTPESYQRLLLRDELERQKALEDKNKPREGRLVDGELIFGDEEDKEADTKERDSRLIEGNTLPAFIGDEFPSNLYGRPIEEIDPYLKEKTFVVIASRFKKKYINRFSATRAFFLLSPWHPLRRAAVYVATNQFFDYFVILTILTNCVFLTFTEPKNVLDVAEYIFLGIYSLEMVVKLTARGLIFNSYTYLRDGWNWLDFIVVVSSYLTTGLEISGNSSALGNIQGLRTFRVLRAFKTVSIIPGLKTIISALLGSMRMLAEVMALMCFCLAVFALFALQVYMGMLRQKCVADIPPGVNVSHSIYLQHVRNPVNWVVGEEEWIMCGNTTGSGACPANFTCLPNVGDNPNYGYTNFDHFGWSLLSNFQFLTLDHWENPYNAIIRANGPWNILYFMIVVFFGSFYLVNLMRAVVVMSYEEEATNAGKEKEQEKKDKKEKEKNDKIKAKAEKDKEDKEDNDKSHLKVLSVNGSSSRRGSHVSLTSLGNGSIPNGSPKSPRKDAGSSAVTHGAKISDSNSSSPARSIHSAKNTNSNNGNSPSITSSPAKSVSSNSGSPAKSVNSVNDASPAKSLSSGGSPVKMVVPTITTEKPTEDTKALGSKIDPLSTIDSTDSQSINSENAEEIDDAPVVKINDQELRDRNWSWCGRCCLCNYCWLKFQNTLFGFVTHSFFELFITICIFLNTVFLAIEHDNQSADLTLVLEVANYVFTVIFALEAILKLLAQSKYYFKTGWNIFDLIIVIASLIDIAVQGIDGLSVFRAFRLVRVLKLARIWPTMKLLLEIVLSSMSSLANLTLIVFLVLYIFAVIGQQLFYQSYTAEVFYPDPVPRWNFKDFGHSLMLIFRILCGEWIEPLWECMRAQGEICMAVFIPALVVGNFMVLNLFLALLINSFASDSLRQKKEEAKEDSKMKQGWHKLREMLSKRKNNATVAPSRNPSLASLAEELRQHHKKLYGDSENVDEKGTREGMDSGSGIELQNMQSSSTASPDGNAGVSSKKINGSIKMDNAFTTDRDKFNEFDKVVSENKKNTEQHGIKDESKATSKFAAVFKKKVEDKEQSKEEKEKEAAEERKKKMKGPQIKEDVEEGIQDCCPAICYTKCCTCCLTVDDTRFGHQWLRVREVVFKMTESKVFEYFILLVILASSICLVFEDIYLDQNTTLKSVLYYMNIVFAVLFSVEMVSRWIAIGFKKYFTSAWTILDFCIVVISIVSLAAESLGVDQIVAFKSLRTLRALRPLRAISRWQGMRIVVNALMYAIPAIFNVMLVCLVFWLIFSIAGVQIFKGKFKKCVNESGERWHADIIPNKTHCLAMNQTWHNSDINFDNAAQGFLALFQVATFEGWIEVMTDAVDIVPGTDQQPRDEWGFGYYLYFVIFIIFGSFFTLNLFIGVIIDNFNMLKKKYEGDYLDMFLTSSQKNYYNTLKKLGNRKPQKTIKRPKNQVQGFFFDVAMSSKFELAIMVLIILNMVAMMVEHYNQSQAVSDALDIINIIFTTIFTLEAVVKLIGLRWHYFRRAWNVFDFIIVLFSIVGVILDDLLKNIFITPTLLRVVRVFRIGRVLRLIKAAKGIRKLLFALVISIPALFNIALLLFLTIFIFAIFGMTSFGNVKHTGALDDMVNFETFANSMVLLFRLLTSAGWNDILGPLLIAPPNCDPNYRTNKDGTKTEVPNGDCGTPWLAIIYMVSFIIISWLIIINMYMAVILENFNQANQQEEVGITEDDFEMFYVTWERYDPYATQFIKYESLTDFVGDLDEPLGIPKPNEIALVAFDLPIVEGDKLHCLDILIALVKNVLGDVEENEEFKEVKAQMDAKFREQFPTRVQTEVKTTTMRRKKEDVAAKTLQRCWRKHRVQKNLRAITKMAMENAEKKREAESGGTLSRRFSHASSVLEPASSKASSAANSPKPARSSLSPQKKKPAAMGNTLKVPTSNIIKLPSDHEANV